MPGGTSEAMTRYLFAVILAGAGLQLLLY